MNASVKLLWSLWALCPGAGIGRFHPLEGSPLISQVESEIPIAFGEISLGLTRQSLIFCSRLNRLVKILGALLIVHSAAAHGVLYRGGWVNR
jgi:hypothetical protein